MKSFRPLKLNFTAGELTPWAHARVDLDLYSRGAEQLENFFVTPFGGLSRRGGTQLNALLPGANENSVLLAFQYSVSDGYLLEFSPNLLRFYQNGKPVLQSNGTVYTLNTPWANPQKIRCTQINNQLYICSPSFAPRILTRLSANQWVLAPLEWKMPPWKTHSLQDQTLFFTRSNESSSRYKLRLQSFVWKGAFEGHDYIRLTLPQSDQTQWEQGSVWNNVTQSLLPASLSNKNYKAHDRMKYHEGNGIYSYFRCYTPYVAATHFNGNTHPKDYPDFFEYGLGSNQGLLYVTGNWEFKTTGLWGGEILLQRSYDFGNTWTTYRSFFSHNDANFLINGDESDEPCHMRLFLAKTIDNTSLTTFSLRSYPGKQDLTFKIITPDIEPNTALAELTHYAVLPSQGSTQNWSLSAFHSLYGHPKCCTWHQNRLFFASTEAQAQSVWASRTNNYHHFKLGSKDTDALELTLCDSSQNSIEWMESQEKLLLGTSGNEWSLEGSNNGALTPTQSRFIKHTHHGSAPTEAIPWDNSLLFVQRGGKKLREFSYKYELDSLGSTELTLFSDPAGSSAFRQILVYQGEQKQLFCVLEKGTLSTLNWISQQNVLAWSQQKLAGQVISLAALYVPTKSYQELWALLKYTTEKGPVFTLEKLCPLPDTQKDASSADKQPVFLDSYKEHTFTQGSYSLEFNGYSHLVGKKLLVFPKNKPHLLSTTEAVNSQGIARLQTPEGQRDERLWVCGLPFCSSLTTLPLEMPESLALQKSLIQTDILLLNSYPSLEYNFEPQGSWFKASSLQASLSSETKTPYYNTTLSLTHQAKHQKNLSLFLRFDSPHPLNILALLPRLSVTETQF